VDTLTQALLGGAVGYAVAGKVSPRKALLWGAAVAVLPDLDVFIPYASDLDAVTMHRSWSHSWLVQSAVAPILAFLAHKKDHTFDLKTWWWLIWLALVTHSALDALTVYGTQLFWPFMPPPVSIGSVFIIDPVYSIPLLAGFIAIVLRPRSLTSRRLMLSGFVFSCAYLTAGLMTQNWVVQQTKVALQQQQIKYDKILVTPTPFNIFLWRTLVINDEQYYQGFHSVFDHKETIHFSHYNRQSELKPLLKDVHALQQLDWFSHGFYALEQKQHKIIARDLRMGIEPTYFFHFVLAEQQQGKVSAIVPYRIRGEHISVQELRRFWRRIWDGKVQLNYHFTPITNETAVKGL